MVQTTEHATMIEKLTAFFHRLEAKGKKVTKAMVEKFDNALSNLEGDADESSTSEAETTGTEAEAETETATDARRDNGGKRKR